MASLLSLPVVPPLEIDEPLRFEQREGKPRFGLKITQHKNAWGEEFFEGRLLTDYGRGWEEEGAAARGIWLPEERVYVLRDQAAEAGARQTLDAEGLKPLEGRAGAFRLSMRAMPRVVRELLREGWHVEAEGKAFRRAGATRVDVSSGIDWFELRGEVDYGGVSATLPQLLAALRRGETMVRLGDGTFGLLPEEWLARFAPLAGLGENEEDHLRFRRNQAGLLDALLAAQPEVHVDEVFARVREKLRDFHGVTPRGAAARVRRPIARLPVRGPRLDAVPARVRFRRLSRRRYGCRQNGAGARRAGGSSHRGLGAVAGGRAEIADVQLARGGGQVHAAAPRPGAYGAGARDRRGSAITISC